MPKHVFKWAGPTLPSDGPVAVYTDNGARLLWRDRDYTQDGATFTVELEDPSDIQLRVVVVPRTQEASFYESEIGRATKWRR